MTRPSTAYLDRACPALVWALGITALVQRTSASGSGSSLPDRRPGASPPQSREGRAEITQIADQSVREAHLGILELIAKGFDTDAVRQVVVDPNRALGACVNAIKQTAPELVRLILVANTQLGNSPRGLALLLRSLLAAGREGVAVSTAGQVATAGAGKATADLIPSLVEALGDSAPASEQVAEVIEALRV